MEALSVSSYRNNLAASFDKADRGDRVLIRRRNNIYALVNVGKEDLMVTPEMQRRIDEAEKECRMGHCVTCRTKEELEEYLSSL